MGHQTSSARRFAASPRRRILALCLGSALLSTACGGVAAIDPGRFTVDVVDRDSGQVLPVFHDHGQAWVAGRPGARYALRLDNRSGERLLAVVAIDGVNVVSGEAANPQQTGYVLDAWQTESLTGWRKSDDEVAAFEFARLADSYAARTGRPQDIGVIGVAVFRERPQRPEIGALRGPVPAGAADRAAPATAAPAPPLAAAAEAGDAPRDAAKSAPAEEAARSAGVPRERLGTGHGQREASAVTHVDFERASRRPELLLQIRYDRIESLVAAGIAPQNWAALNPHRVRPPRPFPADPGAGYVPDPPMR